MPRGDKSSYTDKQKRQAEHIEESEKKEGRSSEASKRIAWASVNKQDGGGKKKTAKKDASKKSPAKKATKKSAAKKPALKSATRKPAAKTSARKKSS
jgi:hypothetical protein